MYILNMFTLENYQNFINRLVSTLNKENIEYMIVGGVATVD